MLRSKQGRSQNWLPSQVEYGVDCSDPDPSNWKPFGTRAEELEQKPAKPKASADSKTSE